MNEQEILNQIITLLWRRDWRTEANRSEIDGLLMRMESRIKSRAEPDRVSRMDVLSLSEAARCLGVAQAKNDVDAMEHWGAEALRLESAICAKAESEKVERVASTLEQEAISHMLEIRRIQRLIDEDRDALTDEELTQGASWITWHVDALNSVIDRITAPQQEQK